MTAARSTICGRSARHGTNPSPSKSDHNRKLSYPGTKAFVNLDFRAYSSCTPGTGPVLRRCHPGPPRPQRTPHQSHYLPARRPTPGDIISECPGDLSESAISINGEQNGRGGIRRQA
jgi:hypothetical protein